MIASEFIMLFSAVPLALIVSLAVYFMYSYGLYKMADNTGLKPAFMAWIPLLRLYMLGQMADRYNSTVEKHSVYRFLLPLLRVSVFGLGVVASVGAFMIWMLGVHMGSWLMIPAAILTFLAELACRILKLLCYYKTFCDYEPEYSVLYLILCILGLEWIPIFLCRNNVPVGIAGHCHPRQPRYNVD